MFDVTFLEFSYNPDITPQDVVYTHLTKLGFSCKREHTTSGLQFWGQAECLLLLRPVTTTSSGCGITGIGLLVTPAVIASFQNLCTDTETDYYLIPDPEHQLNIYLVDAANIKRSYRSPAPALNVEPVFIKITGAEWPKLSESVLTLLRQMADRYITDGCYEKFTFSNKFMLFVNNADAKPVKLVVDTHNVFEATASLATKDIELLKFQQCVSDDQQVGSLTHKAVGYNCVAFGHRNSYSIENYAVCPELNLDIIFRERKNYLKINTDTLVFYNDHQEPHPVHAVPRTPDA